MEKNLQKIRRNVRNDAASAYLSGVSDMTFNVQSDFTSVGYLKLPDEELDRLYAKNWMVRRICEGFAKDLTAKGVNWKLSAEDSELLEREFKRLKVWSLLTEAITFARLYGGSLLVIDMADASHKDALNPDGTLYGFRVFDRTEVTPSPEIVEYGPKAGTSVNYDVSSRIGSMASFKVNESRSIRFVGARCTHRRTIELNNWGDSVITAANNALQQYGCSLECSLELLKRCYLRFLGIQNFWQGLQDDDTASFIGQAIKMINEAQNSSSLTVAGADDVFQSQSYSFAGIRDVLITFSEQVAGATGYPIVKLFGMSPSGFSTGESDLANYYDNLVSEQEDQLREPITRIAQLILESAGRKNVNVDFDFVPFKQESTGEKIVNAQNAVNTILAVHGAGLINDQRALEEISALSEKTGIFSTVTPNDIDSLAEVMPPAIDLSGTGYGE